MMKKLTAIGMVVLIYNLFFYPNLIPAPGRLDFLVFIATILSASWIVFASKAPVRNLQFAYYTSIFSLGTIALSLTRANPIDQAILSLTGLFFTALSVYLLSLKTTKFGGLLEFIIAPLRSAKSWLIAALEEYFFPSVKLKSSSANLTNHLPSPKTAKSVLRGIVIAIPFLFLILGFLASSDPIFADYTQRFFKALSHGQFFSRAFYTIFIIIILIPASVMVTKKPFKSPMSLSFWQGFTIEAQILLGSIAVLLGSFLVIQFRYLFTNVPEIALLQFGVHTYSEYVRRGFGELLVVSAILYLALSVGYATLRNQANRHHFLSFLNIFLLGEFTLFVISIFRRVYLYQNLHGLTRIRIYGMAIVVYIFLLAISLLMRLISKKKVSWYLCEISLGLMLMIGLILIRPDRLIAIHRPPTVNGQIDYVYISRLSIDALPGWQNAIDHATKIVETLPARGDVSTDQVRQLLYAQESITMIRHQYASLAYLYDNPNIVIKLYADDNFTTKPVRSGLMVTNFAQKLAYTQLKQNVPPEVISQLYTQITTALDNLPEELKNIPLDRSYNSPLL